MAEKSGFAASVAKAAPGAAASKDAADKAKPSALQGLFAAAGGAGGDAGWNKELLRYAKLRVVFKRRCTNNVLWILCMLYPGVAGTCIAFFKCKKVRRPPLSTPEFPASPPAPRVSAPALVALFASRCFAQLFRGEGCRLSIFVNDAGRFRRGGAEGGVGTKCPLLNPPPEFPVGKECGLAACAFFCWPLLALPFFFPTQIPTENANQERV